MGHIVTLMQRDAQTIDTLLTIWQSAVCATHDFLSQADVEELRPQVRQALQSVPHLVCDMDEGMVMGFAGVDDQKLEMLFVDASARGQGIGKQLLLYALDVLQVKYVDVNEQNLRAVGFYARMGFHRTGRSAHDDQGRPYPIIHMSQKERCVHELCDT